jgi:hypothetical protein
MQHVLITLKEAAVCRVGKNGRKDGKMSIRMHGRGGEYCIRGQMSEDSAILWSVAYTVCVQREAVVVLCCFVLLCCF